MWRSKGIAEKLAPPVCEMTMRRKIWGTFRRLQLLTLIRLGATVAVCKKKSLYGVRKNLSAWKDESDQAAADTADFFDSRPHALPRLGKDGTLIPNYRKPFDTLAVTNAAWQKKKATSRMRSGLSEIWLPGDPDIGYWEEHFPFVTKSSGKPQKIKGKFYESRQT